jgi:hypothetical protein
MAVCACDIDALPAYRVGAFFARSALSNDFTVFVYSTRLKSRVKYIL